MTDGGELLLNNLNPSRKMGCVSVFGNLDRNLKETYNTFVFGRLAQLARAPALQAGGHWFEPSTAHHENKKALMPFLIFY